MYTKRIIFIILALIYLVWDNYTQYELSNTPVIGKIVAMWESGKSKTMLYQVQYSYGIDTINADGYRYLNHSIGDMITTNCRYVFIMGCSGVAYTGEVDTVVGRNGFKFLLARMIILFSAIYFTFMIGYDYYVKKKKSE